MSLDVAGIQPNTVDSDRWPGVARTAGRALYAALVIALVATPADLRLAGFALVAEAAIVALMMWVKGFALGEAAGGEELTIETMTGRHVTGALSAVNPGYYITYGDPIPELTRVGRDLRAKLAAYRAGEAGPAGANAEGGER